MLLKPDHYIAQRENDEIVASLREDGILSVYIKPNTHITIETQDRMIKLYHQVTDIPRPFLFEAGEFVSISKEARQNAIIIEDMAPVSANALVVKNLGQRILADYYYKFNRTKRPLKVFKDEASAVEWLSTFID